MTPHTAITTAAVVIVASILFVVTAKASTPTITREMGLIYDVSRWPEAARIARRSGLLVVNIDSGRGTDKAEAKRWDTTAGMWRSLGGTTIGYVDYLDQKGIRKGNGDVINECLAWLAAGYTGVFLDDARDRDLDAQVIAKLRAQKPTALIIANPGTRCTGPLKAVKVILCESEKTGTINYASAVIIAFVPDATTAATVRTTATARGVQWLALEPAATYHKPGVEYQRPNPFTK